MPQVTRQGKIGKKSPQLRSLALIAVGSNQGLRNGTPHDTVLNALKEFPVKVGSIRAFSRLFRTAAFPAGSGPDFVNAAFALETELDAADLLSHLHEVESLFRRNRTKRWGPRTLDLDLIAMADQVLPDRETFDHWAQLPIDQQMTTSPERLILPHPRVHERAFVLIPLADVAPEWRHPVRGVSVQEMVDALPENLKNEVEPL
ncbi:2-amino-4-hydroxy-6-hydroxymethyldihydropteridine diphosphokinase [Roseobacter denitrificans]|uniref:2-amino-4-hydroxy-6- hydroxymethyldihydropteridine diphosphokinase n=1 Tax=Roseobacter denitrificans TaxID=2434 RepID=UPI0002EF0A94|nr:2-amino-4-hydroxy-6-hydroxymethyldihydropteridine diphosphokinase [Roseobacter denitrificans]